MTVVPPYEKTRDKLIKEGMTEEQIEEEIERIKEEFSGFVTRKDVLAHILAGRRGISVTVRRKAGKVLVENLEPGMEDVKLEGYILNHWSKPSLRGGNPTVSFKFVDRSGMVNCTLFGDAAEREFEFGFGTPAEVFGRVFSPRPDVIKVTGQRVPKETSLDWKLKEVIPGEDLAEFEMDEHGDGEVVCLEGVCTDFSTSTYPACPDCKTKVEEEATKCDSCGIRFKEPVSLEIGSLTMIDPDGEKSCRVNIPPTSGDLRELRMKPIEIYGVIDKENDRINLINAESLEKPPEREKPPREAIPEEKAEARELKGFLERYGEAPRDLTLSWCKTKLDLEEDIAEALIEGLISSGEIESEGDKIRLSEG